METVELRINLDAMTVEDYVALVDAVELWNRPTILSVLDKYTVGGLAKQPFPVWFAACEMAVDLLSDIEKQFEAVQTGAAFANIVRSTWAGYE